MYTLDTTFARSPDRLSANATTWISARGKSVIHMDEEQGEVVKGIPHGVLSRHEVAVHSTVALLRPYSPCFLSLYGTWYCPDTTITKCTPNEDIEDNNVVSPGMQYVNMPFVEHGTLRDYILEHYSDRYFEIHMKSILFQLLHALHVGQLCLKLTHWDLHAENVLLRTTVQKTRTVNIGQARYVVPTYGICPVLCDYEFSAIEIIPGFALFRQYTREEKVTLVGASNVDFFRPFVRGYDQTVLGAYILDLLLQEDVLGLSETERVSFLRGEYTDKVERCSCKSLLLFLRDDMTTRDLIQSACAQDELRPHSIEPFYNKLNNTTPAAALGSHFFLSYAKGELTQARKRRMGVMPLFNFDW